MGVVSNFIKGIFFIAILLIFFQCKNKQNSELEGINSALKEGLPQSGWYKFPLKLEIDSGSMFKAQKNVNKKEYYSNAVKYIDCGKSVVLKASNNQGLLSNNQLIMQTKLVDYGNVIKWLPPKTKELKSGIPLLFHNYDGKERDSRIFFDQSKKIDDNLLVVSLIVDPKDLFDYDSGIYVQGVFGDENNSKKGNYSQRGKEWQKQVKVHLFENNGDLKLGIDAGLKIHGNFSRAQPQKSFTLMFKKRFQSHSFTSNLFGKTNKIYQLMLRTPFTSSMQGQSLIMDSYISQIAIDIGLDAMASAPCNLYINGEYWGVYHLREKINQHYFKEKYNVSKKSIEIIEFDRENTTNYNACYGDSKSWLALIQYLDSCDLSNNAIYTEISNRIDVDNLIDYLIISTFFANKDWPSNNFKFWKSSELDNKWRFIIHDMDACFRKDNMFKYLLDKEAKKGNNTPQSTFLFKKFFSNNLFTAKFIKRYKELKEDALLPANLKDKLRAMSKNISPSIPFQIDRWHMPESEELWQLRINKMLEYLDNRGEEYEKHLVYIQK